MTETNQTAGSFAGWVLKIDRSTQNANIDARVVPGELIGDGLITNAHAWKLLSIAEESKPEEGVETTPWNYSVVEHGFLTELFTDFLGMPENWFLGRALGYAFMHFDKERNNSPHLQKLYSGFGNFFESLDLKTRALALSYSPSEQDKFIQKHFQKEEDQLEVLDHISKNKDQNWSCLYDDIAPLFGILWEDQLVEAQRYCPSLQGITVGEPKDTGFSPKQLTNKIKKTKSSILMLKGIVHKLAKTEFVDETDPEKPKRVVIDNFEKETLGKLIAHNFEGFNELIPPCIDDMFEDISRKDILFYFALTGRFEGANIPYTIEYNSRHTGITKKIILQEEVAEVIDKVKRTKKLLSAFEQKPIDKESLGLISYALNYIIGIRGLTNCSLMLQEYNFNEDELEEIGLHDVPELKPVTENINYSFRRCTIPGIQEIVVANPQKF